MKIFYDTEFHENGKTIDLISIGLVAEDGREYYAVSSEFDWQRAANDRWLAANVLSHLPTVMVGPDPNAHRVLDRSSHVVLARAAIAADVETFIRQTPQPELWAYYTAYDHVALAQLWGRMVDRPNAVPMFTRDIKQEAARLGVSSDDLPKQLSGEHHALADARHNQVMLAFLADRATR
ncbi:3'-5' exoribonuclease domain-containing protein [Pendulispora albinea]|uniref:3'-5' exoribonuclease n=1 Tax=Pendulispora albinea TaxID=2741071 RepID=A0ABZ2M250_9BACT